MKSFNWKVGPKKKKSTGCHFQKIALDNDFISGLPDGLFSNQKRQFG
jgi:hypothetical protein